MRGPLHDELRLARASWKERRTDPQHVRASGRKTDALEKLLSRPRRTAAEPLVETLRAGDDDPLPGKSVHADRLVRLRVVPDEQGIDDVPDDGLAREVVPAPDQYHRRDTARLRAAQDVDLRPAAER